jgi:molybdopterin/thiamine biosynthesis adenylyltransferase
MRESRYNRQILVDGIGERGQEAIRKARVALVGVGALGCAVADQLVRGGIGYMRLIDPDTPEISNLQRQVLIDEEDVKNRIPKALAAASKLKRANSEVIVEPRVTRLAPENAGELLADVSLVLDGTDNFAARYLMNRTCLDLGTPWIFGGVLGTSGMSLPILPGGPCLQCALGPEPPAGTVPTTAEQGVLSSIVAAIASIEVVRAIKIIVGKPPVSKLALFDIFKESFRAVSIERDPSCPACRVFH